MADIDYYKAFGLEPPDEGEESEGANEQDIAETADNEAEEDAGENEQESADPADVDEGEQSAEENAKYANIRRKAEAEAMDKVNREIAALGLRDDKGNNITSLEAFSASQKAAAEQKQSEEFAELRDKLLDAGFSESDADNIIEGQKARGRIAELEQYQAEQKQKAFQEDVAAQIAFIHKINPDINSLDDLANLDKFNEIYKAVDAGATIKGAYLEVYADDLIANKGVRKNTPAGKSHLTGHKTKNGDAYDLPDDVYAEYRKWDPHITKAEAAKHYAKDKKIRRK